MTRGSATAHARRLRSIAAVIVVLSSPLPLGGHSLDGPVSASAAASADAAARSGELLRLEGQLAESERALARALELDPDHPGAWLSLAMLELDRGHLATAVDAAGTSLALGVTGPRRTAALVTRARARMAMGRPEAALSDLDEAIEGAIRPTPELYLERLGAVETLGRTRGWPSARVAAAAVSGLEDAISRIGPAVPLMAARSRYGAIEDRRPLPTARGTASSSAGPASPLADRHGALEAPLELLRGPYLQQATPSSIVVRWRTATASDSRVWFGPDEQQLDLVVDDPVITVDHEVPVAGLEPGTCMSYAVGSTTQMLAGGDSDHRWCTTSVDDTGSLTVWVIGDSGTADANAAAVRDAYLASGLVTPPDLWLMLGDNAYPDGTDPEYQAAVFEMYPTLLRRVPVWPTFGNHDAHSASSFDQSGVYFDLFTLPTLGEAGGLPSGNEAYYSFDAGPAHFVCLDSSGFATPSAAMLEWLSADLAASRRPWTIVFFHHPPYTKGSHDSDNPSDSGGRMRAMREQVLPILEAWGVDLVLSGHSHSYERSLLIDHHYGTSGTLTPDMILDPGDGSPLGDGPYRTPAAPHRGAVYAVAGSSGKTSGGTLDHPVMHLSLDELGSMVLTVDGADRLEGLFLDAGSPGVIRDRFRIERDPAAIFADGLETGSSARWSRVVP